MGFGAGLAAGAVVTRDYEGAERGGYVAGLGFLGMGIGALVGWISSF